MEPWMRISLLPPPVRTTEIKEKIDVLGLRHICDNIVRVLSKQSPLYKEGALLSRFIYKYDKKFRNDIGYRNIKKTHSTLRKYLQVNLLKDLENFTAVLPNEDDDFIPSKQMLEYVLLRIITLSKLMVRIYICSKQAAVFYMNRVKKGESHWMSLMPYALLSRIWSICSVLLQHTTSWYSSLHSNLAFLQPKGLIFLPDGYELPNNLEEWLDLKNLDMFGKINWSQHKHTSIGLALHNDEESDTFDNILDYASNVNEETSESKTEFSFIESKDLMSIDQPLSKSNNTKIDHGEAISRDSFKALNLSISQNRETMQVQNITKTDQGQAASSKLLISFQKKMSNANDKASHYFGNNAKSLKEFLDREEMFRNDGNKLSLSKHLSFMQWHSLKSSLLKLCDSVLNNRKIEKKLQKVWKEKCLDYL